MIGLYFSGTGNTRHCVERFVAELEPGAECFSIEDEGVLDALAGHRDVVFGFPVYYSNLPKIAKDFIRKNAAAFMGKRVFIIATMGAFNAYGVGHAKRLFEKRGATFSGSLQLVMPDNIRDLLIMEIAFSMNYAKIIAKTDKKIKEAAAGFKANERLISGLSPFNVTIGAVLRALPFYPKTDNYISAPKVDAAKCAGCGKCAKNCPMKNIKTTSGKAVSSNRCTICYRCFNTCPAKALTILGKRVYDQYNFPSDAHR